MAGIYDALSSIPWEKSLYFRYKFPELRYDQSLPLKSEEEFLKRVNRKTINPYLQWEKSDQYKNLIQLYLNTKIADDMEEIYKVVSQSAKKGDDKSVRLFLQMSKEIQSNAKTVGKLFETKDNSTSTEDDYDLDLD